MAYKINFCRAGDVMGVIVEKGRNVKFDHDLGMNIPVKDWVERHPDSPLAEHLRGKSVKRAGVRLKREEIVRRNGVLSGLLVAGVEPRDALEVVGANPSSTVLLRHPDVKEAVLQTRERLQQKPGYTLEDSATFYRGISENAKVAVGDRIKARTRIDKILGLEPDKQINIAQNCDLKVAIDVLKTIGMSPADAVRLAEDAEIEDGEYDEDCN